MDKYKRITDLDIFKTLESMKNNEENSMAEYHQSVLMLLLDIRHFLRKINKNNRTVVYGDPTSTMNNNDIIVGKEEK